MADWKSAMKDLRKALKPSAPSGKTNSGSVIAPDTGRRAASPAPVVPHTSGKQARQSGARPISGSQAPQPPAGMKAMPSAATPTAPLPPRILPMPAPVPSELRAPRNPRLTRQKFFRVPAPWTHYGERTQTSSFVPSALAADVVIGIDFGTSFTKAAVGLRDQIYPVSWHGVLASPEHYLLPSEYSVLADGTAVLGQHPQSAPSDVRKDLKLPFIHPGVSQSSIATAAVFLALVLQYVRAWVFEYHAGKLGPAPVRWQLNIGAPCDGLEDDRLQSAYRRLAGAAWCLSLEPATSMMSRAYGVVSDWNDSLLPDLTDLAVCPEFVAQIAGYVQSPQRIPGLHALADIGGGTIDIVTFIVHRIESEDTFPFLVPSVKWLGTQMLLQNRLEGTKEVDSLRIPDALSPVLDPATFAAQTGLSEPVIQERDRMLFNAVNLAVAEVFGATRMQRYRLSDAWTTGLRTFVTGGGATVTGYCDAISRGGMTRAKRIDLMPLPVHPKLAEFERGTEEYQRISVACGLAQDAWSLGRVIPAKDVEDDSATLEGKAERPDRDELYAR